MKTIAKKQTSTAQVRRANHRENLKTISNQAKELRHEWALTDCPIGFVWKRLSLNEVIVRMYQEQTGAKEFKTLQEWNKLGRRIRKGETAFPVWATAEKASLQKQLLDKGDDAEHWYTLWPMAYLYHEGQTTPGPGARNSLNEAITEYRPQKRKQAQPREFSKVKLSFQSVPGEMMTITSSGDASDLLRKYIYDPDTVEHHEFFYILLLNRANKCYAYYRVSEGGISSTVIDCRMILQAAILSNATGMILSHNHPSGNCNPSDSDITITRKIKTATEFMDIKLLDHIIIGPGSSGYSFADEGII